MAIQNGLNTSLSGQTGNGSFSGSNSPTLVTPIIGQINDATGNVALQLAYVASAVNYPKFNNSATGNPVGLQASGTDANIQFNLASKGISPVVLASASTVTPVQFISGASYQHTTNWAIPNTATTQTVSLQDASGTLAFLSDRGWVLISSASASASNSASLDFTNLTGYTNYMAVFNDVTPLINNGQILVLVSIDNGASYITTTSYLATAWALIGATGIAGTNLSQTAIIATNAQSNVTSGANGSILFEGMNSSTNTQKGYWFNTTALNSTPALCTLSGGGLINISPPVNALRFVMSSGIMARGNIQIYGLK